MSRNFFCKSSHNGKRKQQEFTSHKQIIATCVAECDLNAHPLNHDNIATKNKAPRTDPERRSDAQNPLREQPEYITKMARFTEAAHIP